VALWKASISSGEAVGTALIKAESIAQAKNSLFNQFLGLEESQIMWQGQPTFWVVCLSMQQFPQQEDANED